MKTLFFIVLVIGIIFLANTPERMHDRLIEAAVSGGIGGGALGLDIIPPIFSPSFLFYYTKHNHGHLGQIFSFEILEQFFQDS